MLVYLELTDPAVAPRDHPSGRPAKHSQGGFLWIILTPTFICKVEIIPCSAEAS